MVILHLRPIERQSNSAARLEALFAPKELQATQGLPSCRCLVEIHQIGIENQLTSIHRSQYSIATFQFTWLTVIRV